MTASIATLARRYEAGESLRSLAESEHLSYEAIRQRLDGLVEPRRRGRPAGARTGSATTEIPLPEASRFSATEWEAAMTARLAVIRAHRPRWTFAEAWHQAVKDHKVPMDRQAVPNDELFDETGERYVTRAEFFERVCSDAWEGLRPALAHFSPALLLSADEGFTSTDVILA